MDAEQKMRDVTALILAGGKGTRIAQIHPGIPKPTLEVAGKPFLFFLLSQLKQAGVKNVVVSVGYNAPLFVERMQSFIPEFLNVFYSEEPTPLGTGGGAAYAARDYVGKVDDKGARGPFLVMNGDSILLGNWTSRLSMVPIDQAAIVVRHINDVSRYGAVSVDGGFLTGFAEKGRTGPGWINAGIYQIPFDWIDEVPEQKIFSIEEHFFPMWLKQGRKIVSVCHEGPFIDIGTPESLNEASQFVLHNLINV